MKRINKKLPIQVRLKKASDTIYDHQKSKLDQKTPQNHGHKKRNRFKKAPLCIYSKQNTSGGTASGRALIIDATKSLRVRHITIALFMSSDRCGARAQKAFND